MVLGWLLPDFSVRDMEVAASGVYLKRRVVVESQRHLVLGVRVLPPGLVVTAETPARHAVFGTAIGLLVSACLMLRRSSGTGAAILALAALLWAALVMTAVPAWVLAGSVADLLWAGRSLGPSVEAIALWGSRSLLQGGAVAAGLLLALLVALRLRNAALPPPAANPAPW